jgi:hypothetical protein
MRSWIPDSGGGLDHWSLLEIASKVFGVFYIVSLGTLVPTCKKDDYCLSLFNEVDPIARPVMNSKF